MADEVGDATASVGAVPAHDLWPEEVADFASDEKRGKLQHSARLDVHTWSEHPEANQFVDQVYAAHFGGRKANIRKRHLKVVLLDLYVNWFNDPTLVTSFSRNKNDYKAGSIYNALNISNLTIDVVDVLIDAGLVEQEIGFLDRKSGIGRMSRIWPTNALINLFRDARFSPFDVNPHEGRLTVVLRSKDEANDGLDLVEYEPTPETERMSAMLRDYNALLWRTFIDIPELETPFIPSSEVRVGGVVQVNQHAKFTRRIFNRGSFECGGRFWGGWWQRCPKEWRSQIFINDDPTNEIDFSGLHVVMLYGLEGISYWEEDGTDPYTIDRPEFIEDDAQARSIVKALMLLLLNASTDKQAYGAFRLKASPGSPERHFRNEQLAQIKEALAEKHPRIAKHFGSDAGIMLMNKDAQITEIILSEFVGRSIPILSIHDSYIVPDGCVDFLTETMAMAFETVIGIPLLSFADKAMKEGSDRIEFLLGILQMWMPYDNVPGQAENEKAYIDRAHPRRSERYTASYNLFREWCRGKEA
jgi:hypothetical protein